MSRRRVIGLLLGNAGLRGTDYQGLIRAGVEQRCKQFGIDLWVYAGRHAWEARKPERGLVYELVSADRVDGIIFAGAVIACFMDLRELHETVRKRCPVPMASIGYHLEGVPSILVENGPGMAGVVEHLARDHGRQRFGFIAGPEGHNESEERLRAARGVLERYGIAHGPEAVVHGNFSRDSGVLGMRELADRLKNIDAVVAANDDMAVGAMETIGQRGWHCPDDVAVTGFDDDPTAQVCIPSITTVRQPVFRMGMEAADHIIAAWEGEACPLLTMLETEPVFRASCGCDPLLGPRPSTASGVPEVGRTPRTLHELATMLVRIVGSFPESQAWAHRLWHALQAERSGHVGAFRRELQELLDVVHPDTSIFDMQRVIMHLRAVCADESWGSGDTFCQALVQVSYAMHTREMRRRLDDSFVLDALRVNWKRMATSLSLNALRDVLEQDLPHFSVRNAIVSVYPPGDTDHLIPLACLVDEHPVPLAPVAFPAHELKPDGLPSASTQCSLTVLPLTFEREPLGIAILELPVKEAYQALREQISSAIQTVRLYEEVIQQQERLKAQAQAESRATAERLRLMSLIAGGVAHDLNNTLGPLLALPDAIRRDLEINPAVGADQFLADLDTLKDAAQHAAHTIRDLLTLGRTIDLPMRTVDLNRILEVEGSGLTRLAERAEGVRLRMIGAGTPLFVYASREHLLRAISNLVTNAADATTRGGEVIVRALERDVPERLDGVEPVEPGHYAVIEVQDSGCGIPSANLPHVLEPFFTSKVQTARGGTGLGLAIVHQIVRQCKGYVQVKSQVGVGTICALYLPLVTHGDVTVSLTPAAVRGGNERILVVDDEPLQLRTAQRLLRQLGYRVRTADSGQNAIELFEQASPEDPFHLVILDVMMPGSLNGLETLERLRAHVPFQKALMVTGYAPEQLARDAADASLQWLVKPYTATSLATTVRHALDGGTAGSAPRGPEKAEHEP